MILIKKADNDPKSSALQILKWGLISYESTNFIPSVQYPEWSV